MGPVFAGLLGTHRHDDFVLVSMSRIVKSHRDLSLFADTTKHQSDDCVQAVCLNVG